MGRNLSRFKREQQQDNSWGINIKIWVPILSNNSWGIDMKTWVPILLENIINRKCLSPPSNYKKKMPLIVQDPTTYLFFLNLFPHNVLILSSQNVWWNYPRVHYLLQTTTSIVLQETNHIIYSSTISFLFLHCKKELTEFKANNNFHFLSLIMDPSFFPHLPRHIHHISAK